MFYVQQICLTHNETLCTLGGSRLTVLSANLSKVRIPEVAGNDLGSLLPLGV